MLGCFQAGYVQLIRHSGGFALAVWYALHADHTAEAAYTSKGFAAPPTFSPGANPHPPDPFGGVIIVKFYTPLGAGRLPTHPHPLQGLSEVRQSPEKCLDTTPYVARPLLL
jgi:hypothetical protein